MRNELHEFTARVGSHWRVKLWLGAVLTILFCAGYFGLQYIHLGTPRTFVPSVLDECVPFSPEWVVVYFSMYPMLALAWLATTRTQLTRYTVGLAIIAAIGFTCFFVFPVAGPRADSDGGGLLALLQRIDSPLNSFPSLHVALAVYSVCFCGHVLGRRPAWLLAGLGMWVVLIAYSTLATRQHYFIDLPPGAALGWFGYAAAGALLGMTSRDRFVAAAAPAEGGVA